MEFTEQKMLQRLKDLTGDSIQTCSRYLLHFAKPVNLDLICDTWLKEVMREKSSKRLINLVYLSNDVVQMSKKKGNDVVNAFFPRIETAFRHIRKRPHEEPVDKCCTRCIEVWDARKIFNQDQMHKLEHIFGLRKHSNSTPSVAPSTSSFLLDSPEKNVTKQPELNAEKMIQLERGTKEMGEVLRRLEKAPSSDETIRRRIADYPESTANTSFLQYVRNEEGAKEILEQTKDAGPLCKEYCESLANEVLDRRNLQNHLNELLDTLRAVVTRNNGAIEDLKKQEAVMKSQLVQVQNAFDSLPDLSEMELDFNHSNLPSVKDLFS